MSATQLLDNLLDDVRSGAMTFEEALDHAYFAGRVHVDKPIQGDARLLTALCTMGTEGPKFAVASLGGARVSVALASIVTTYVNTPHVDLPVNFDAVALVAAKVLFDMGIRGGVVDQVLNGVN